MFAWLLVRAAGLGAPVRPPPNPIGAMRSEGRNDQTFLVGRAILYSEGDSAGFAEKVASGDRP